MLHQTFIRFFGSLRSAALFTVCSSLALVLLTSIQACGTRPPDEQVEPPAKAHGGAITWFEGSVEDAFAHAKSEGKPIFLYWGAEWCPPCYYLQDKLFTRPEFIARMQDFVPLYLDGDTERAQIWGEELDVMGYPTVIVFSPAGDEVMRLPSTLPVDQYQEVLDAAVGSTRPVKHVLDDVMAAGPSSADPADLSTLAFYSWGQDSSVGLDAKQRREIFRQLSQEAPEELEVERSRFLTRYLMATMEERRLAVETEAPEPMNTAELEELRLEALRILGDEQLRSANLVWVLYYSADTVELLTPGPGEPRTELVGAWLDAAIDLENDSELPVSDRLSALRPQIALVKLSTSADASAEGSESWEAPQELQQHVRERVTWAADLVTDEGELQTVMNTMAWLLSWVGLESEAESLLAARMNDTVAPYYFMSWIGSIREDAGETDEALAWYRKAYESSRGRYSRFRWGSMYLRHLLELAPEDTATIQAHSAEILGELLALEDAFAGGNYSRLQGLESAYRTWNESGDHQVTIDSLRESVHSSCQSYPAEGEDSQQSRCLSFLQDEEETVS